MPRKKKTEKKTVSSFGKDVKGRARLRKKLRMHGIYACAATIHREGADGPQQNPKVF
jgi:hypothetical protein